MRRLFTVAAGALSIACAGSADEPIEYDPRDCGWALTATVTMAITPGESCTWGIRSLDIEAVRLRSEFRPSQCIGDVDGCVLRGCGSLRWLTPGSLVELWGAPGVDGATALGLIEATGCR